MTVLEQLRAIDADELVDTDPLALRNHLNTAVAEIARLTRELAATAPPF